MPIYIRLAKYTDQGIKSVKEAPQRVQDGLKNMEKTGGKTLGFWSTMGEYDYVAVEEWPDDAAAAARSLAMGMHGTVRTTTLKAFTPEEFAKIVKSIP
jgi:uncharacterized protein with GYD domain